MEIMGQHPEGAEVPARVERMLVFGDVGLQYSVERQPGTPVVVASLEAEAGDGQRAVEYLQWQDMLASRITVYSQSGELLASVTLDEPIPTFSRVALHARFTELLASQEPLIGRELNVNALTPLLVLRTHHGLRPVLSEVLACTRIRAIGALFARVTRFTAEDEADLAQGRLVSTALKSAPALLDNIGHDFRLYTAFDAETEIEMKFLVKGKASPWGLASRLVQQIGTADFPGFIPDVGNEHQRTQTRQVTYEVIAPAEEVGYIAFIPKPTGTYHVKRKCFAEDAKRRERIYRAQITVPSDDFEAFLAQEYPTLTTRRLPLLTRAKFDVNVESARTGHFFGIVFDEVTIADDGPVMRQIELEYHRSRIHEGLDGSSIDEEMEQLATLVESYLVCMGVEAERTFYSKLSFLRDAVATSV